MVGWKLKSDIPLYYPDKSLPSYDEGQLKDLVNRYLVDPSYRNVLVESQMRLTFTIASVYMSRYNHDQEELVSDALFSLINAVDRFKFAAATDPDISLPAYVNSTIWKELKKTVLKNRLIPIPSSTLHRKLREGTLDQADVVSMLSDDLETKQVNHEDEYSMSDFINVVISCDDSKRILRMRVAKYKDFEIADELKVKVSYVWNKCREIRQSLSLYME